METKIKPATSSGLSLVVDTNYILTNYPDSRRNPDAPIRIDAQKIALLYKGDAAEKDNVIADGSVHICHIKHQADALYEVYFMLYKMSAHSSQPVLHGYFYADGLPLCMAWKN